MPGVFTKLHFKEQQEILVLNAPQSFEAALAGLRGVRILRRLPRAAPVDFALGR